MKDRVSTHHRIKKKKSASNRKGGLRVSSVDRKAFKSYRVLKRVNSLGQVVELVGVVGVDTVKIFNESSSTDAMSLMSKLDKHGKRKPTMKVGGQTETVGHPKARPAKVIEAKSPSFSQDLSKRATVNEDSESGFKKSMAAEDLQKCCSLAKRFDALAQLKNGWCRNCGIAPDKAGLKFVSKKLLESYPEHLRLPVVSATLDGNLILEWGTLGYVGTTPCIGGGPSANIDLTSLTASFYYFGKNGKGIGKHFDLKSDSGVQSFIGFLQDHIPNGSDDVHSSEPDVPSLYSIAAERFADFQCGRSSSHSIEALQEYGLGD